MIGETAAGRPPRRAVNGNRWCRPSRFGRQLVGHFLPREGCSCEAYRTRLKADPEGRANFALAQSARFILREQRRFLQGVPGTLHQPAQGVAP